MHFVDIFPAYRCCGPYSMYSRARGAQGSVALRVTMLFPELIQAVQNLSDMGWFASTFVGCANTVSAFPVITIDNRRQCSESAADIRGSNIGIQGLNLGFQLSGTLRVFSLTRLYVSFIQAVKARIEGGS
jgi:hypothetical protein